MKKAFSFVESLTSSFYDQFGFPQIKVYGDFVEVIFTTSHTFRSFDFFDVNCSDEFRFFPSDGGITFVWTFFNDK